MNRILVIGPGGAGKSTVAAKLGEILELPVVHLDSLFWLPGWIESPREQFAAKLESILQDANWVIDGNYSGTLQQRLSVCDCVVFLDLPRWICIYRVLGRAIRYRGTTRPDMADGCPERLNAGFLRWVWNYRKRSHPKVLSLLSNLQDHQSVFHLRSNAEVNRFLTGLVKKIG